MFFPLSRWVLVEVELLEISIKSLSLTLRTGLIWLEVCVICDLLLVCESAEKLFYCC